MKRIMIDHIIEELHNYGFTDTDNMSTEELMQKLAVIKAMEVDVTNSSNRWF